MGKKARIRRYPQKYAKKFNLHPYVKKQATLKNVDRATVITPEPVVDVKPPQEEADKKKLIKDTVEKPALVAKPVVEKPAAKKATPKKPAAKKATAKSSFLKTKVKKTTSEG